MALQVGVWDSFEAAEGVPPARQYAERLDLVARAEALGFSGYHVAEHHLSPLSMAPSPLLYLAALSQRTSRIRIGPMVTILPLYPAIRLAQELCMLDGLCGGRLEFGVGRGIRDVEHEWYGHDPARSRDEFTAALARIRRALLEHVIEAESPAGPADVPFPLRATQQPMPPFWYVGNIGFAAAEGMSVLAPQPKRAQVDEYWDIWESRRAAGSPLHQGPAPVIGATRPVFVAETARDAEVVAKRAWDVLGDHFWATDTRVAGHAAPFKAPVGSFGGGDIHDAFDRGHLLFGDPGTVRDVLGEFLTAAGPRFTYLVSSFQWGDITHEEAGRSLELFAAEVAPALKALHAGL